MAGDKFRVFRRFVSRATETMAHGECVRGCQPDHTIQPNTSTVDARRRPHQYFSREGNNLIYTSMLSLADALTDCIIEVRVHGGHGEDSLSRKHRVAGSLMWQRHVPRKR